MNIVLLPILFMYFVLITLKCKYVAFGAFGHMQNQTVLRFIITLQAKSLSTENTGVTRSKPTEGYLGIA